MILSQQRCGKGIILFRTACLSGAFSARNLFKEESLSFNTVSCMNLRAIGDHHGANNCLEEAGLRSTASGYEQYHGYST